jgi:hypothetical protein
MLQGELRARNDIISAESRAQLCTRLVLESFCTDHRSGEPGLRKRSEANAFSKRSFIVRHFPDSETSPWPNNYSNLTSNCQWSKLLTPAIFWSHEFCRSSRLFYR